MATPATPHRTRRRDHATPPRAAAASTASPPDGATDGSIEGSPDASMDAVLDEASQGWAREQLAWEIGAKAVLLRGAESLREVQRDAAHETRQAHDEALARLSSARGLAELAAVQLELARAEVEGTTRYWQRVGALGTASALEWWSESAGALTRLHGAAWSSALQWMQLQSQWPLAPEAIEAEVDHVTNPLVASPWVWPAQDAARQAVTLAAASWGDWLNGAGSSRATAG